MDLCDRGGSEWRWIEAREELLERSPQLALDGPPDVWKGQGRHTIAQSRQRQVDDRWQKVVPQGSELAHLGKGSLEASEHSDCRFEACGRARFASGRAGLGGTAPVAQRSRCMSRERRSGPGSDSQGRFDATCAESETKGGRSLSNFSTKLLGLSAGR
jgi:hypothetical protein